MGDLRYTIYSRPDGQTVVTLSPEDPRDSFQWTMPTDEAKKFFTAGLSSVKAAEKDRR